MTKKIRVAIICGGKSAEHEVSLQSAANIVKAMDPNKFEAVIIGVDKTGCWHALEQQSFLENQGYVGVEAKVKQNRDLQIWPGHRQEILVADSQSTQVNLNDIDVVFPIIHGTFGEDGTLQGLLKLADLPFVGPDVLGSAVGMDKDVMKRLLIAANIPVAKAVTLRSHQRDKIYFEEIVAQLGLPLFVKPCNAGSSVGVSKVKSKEDFQQAINAAFRFDHKILIEEAIVGQELECAVLGNEKPEASIVGELILHHEFYSYEAKYIDAQGATVEIPAKIPVHISDKIRQLACKAFEVLECSGLARVDFFLTPDEKIYLNEINTLPGFTSISMYPMLWQASGLAYSKLIERLIELAIEKHQRDAKLDRVG